MIQNEKTIQMPTAISEDQSNDPKIKRYFKEQEFYQKSVDEFNKEEFTDEELTIKFIKAGISKRHLDASIDNIAKNVHNDLKGFFNNESYYIYGEVGCGKTYLVSALLKEYIIGDKYKMVCLDEGSKYNSSPCVRMKSPKLPYLISLPDLLLKIRLVFKENSEHTEEDIISEFTNEQFLVLDDIGVEKPTEWVLQTLYTIIDRRNRNLKQTVFTSNYPIKGLKERVGERIVSRIVELCGKNNILNLKGKDRRLEAV